jgi:hypothetical protein
MIAWRAPVLRIGKGGEDGRKGTYFTMVSARLNEADSRVVRFRPRMAASHRSHRGKAPVGHSAPDYSPVPDLSIYERPESADDYRHRMVVNAVALVFVILLILSGLWLLDGIARS